MSGADTGRQLRLGRLPSGLRLLTESDPQASTVAAGFFIASGARHDRPGGQGAAHFLEHLLFKGSERLSAAELNERLDWLGGAHNAFTSQEQTVYHIAGLPEDLPQLLETLRELLNPALREADIAAERGVILEEIAMYASQPGVRVVEAMQAEFWGTHPLGQNILGSPGSVSALDRTALHTQLQQAYAPQNVLLVITGALDEAEVWAWAERELAHWPWPGAALPTAAPAVSPTPSGQVRQLVWPGLERAQGAFAWPGLPSCHPLRAAATVLAELAGGENSRLYWTLLDSGLADSADLGHLDFRDCGSFEGGFSCDPDRAGEVTRLFLDTVAGLHRHPPTPAEVSSAARRLAAETGLRADTPAERLFVLGLENMHQTGERPISPEDLTAEFRAVTSEQVAAVLSACSLTQPSGALLLPAP
ncbi:M16 family metallopeptidase [Deinococcus sp. SL84]|uniref:M16 family metallopeptidase n=1 Tax=Deinococcus sp. SL84 TaxID=2994663 RepID=UPI002273BEE4|nr:pitrilysin family protein [Deinococcus sp. SL84]MCY1703310.1 pitrilysin family protein [Deinococcus sp. SL84]